MGRIAEALKRAQQERDHRLKLASSDRIETDSPNRLAGGIQSDSDVALDPAGSLFSGTILRPPPTRKPFTVTSRPMLPEAVDPRVVAFHEPASAIAEKYRSVRTRLLTNNPGGSARVHAIASTLRQEGRTITVANLGFSLAELRHLRVAMIDLDLRQQGLTRLFKADDRPGVAEVLRGEKRLADVCIPVVRDNLHIIPAGHPGQAGSSELLAGDPMASLFREINERYHYALVDTPPIHTCADIGLIGPLCHSVLVVVRMNRTPEPLLRRSVKMLQANHLTIAGCILAGVPDQAMNFDESQDIYAGGPQ